LGLFLQLAALWGFSHFTLSARVYVRDRERIPMLARGVTVQEAAAYLSATVPAIRRLISKSELPYAKLGKRYIIDRQDLDKWLEKKKHIA
jgi:excisionase family DNA binding protein